MKNGGFIFSIIIFSTFAVVFGFFIAPALAQDAIQCTPGDVNLNRNLKFVNLASNNIYLGTGKLNFSSTDANLYATNNGGLLLHNANANILIQSNNILFSDDIAGANRLAGIYSADPGSSKKAKSNDRYFIVDGKIEGWKVNALGNLPNGGLCVQGKCLTDWPTSCGGTQKLTAVGTPSDGIFSCSNDIDTRCDVLGNCANVITAGSVTANSLIPAQSGDVAGKRLCIQGDCISDWGEVMSSFTGGSINMSSNSLTFGDQTNLVMENGAVFRICKDVNGDGNHDLASNPFTGPVSNDDYSDPNECSTGQGVSKIIAGSGITISSTPTTGNPGSGIGDVTIDAKAEGMPKLLYKGSQWTEEAIIDIDFTAGYGTPQIVNQKADTCCGGPNRIQHEILSWPESLNSIYRIYFIVRNIGGDDYCVGGSGQQNLQGARINPYCEEYGVDENGVSFTGWTGNQDDWARLSINGTQMITCPMPAITPSSGSAVAKYGDGNLYNVGCRYDKYASPNPSGFVGPLSTLKIETADWSPSFSAWEIEIWYEDYVP